MPRSNIDPTTCAESNYLITFSVKSKFLKSVMNHRINTKTFGIEYNNCCVSLTNNIDMKVFYKNTFIKTVVLTSVEYFSFTLRHELIQPFLSNCISEYTEIAANNDYAVFRQTVDDSVVFQVTVPHQQMV